MGESSESFSADHAGLNRLRFPANGFVVCSELWKEEFCRALSTAKSVISCVWNLLLFATSFAFNDFWRLAFVMANQESGSGSIAGQWSSTSASTYFWSRRGFSMVRQIVVLYRSLCGQVVTTAARAEFRAWAFLAFHRVCPTWRVVRESIFGHGLCLLGGPSLVRSWASFSWSKDNMPASYLQGVMA
jgi:hypothetical protein